MVGKLLITRTCQNVFVKAGNQFVPKIIQSLQIMSDHKSEWGAKGGIEVGGLLALQGTTRSLWSQRRAYYRIMLSHRCKQLTTTICVRTIPRMPVLAPDRKTRVAFGGGGR